MMQLNHGKLKKISLENKLGIIRINFFLIHKEIIDNSEKIANEFNNFLVSIGHNLAKDITCNVNPLFCVNSVNDSILVEQVFVAQLTNVITSLKDSSPG